MTKPHWAAIEMALRSYMADVTGRQKWSPIHDTLHYALITGNDGERRWHLVHPDAMPALQKLGCPYALHDQLGGAIRDGSDVTIRGSFHANRVSSVIGDHPDLGPVVIKGHEAHTYRNGIVMPSTEKSREFLPTQRSSEPPRSLRWSEKPDPRAPDGKAGAGELLNLHTDLLPYEAKIREKLGMNSLSQTRKYKANSINGNVTKATAYLRPQAGTIGGSTKRPLTEQLDSRIDNGFQYSGRDTAKFGPTAEWVTQAGRVAGAPMVPVWQGRIGSAKDAANAESPEHPDWYISENQYASFQPYVADAAEAAHDLGVTHLRERELSPEHRQWIRRLAGRLSAAEDITGAPDCHDGNYVDVPCLMPDGNIMTVKHGIDYEWQSNKGIVGGSTLQTQYLAKIASREAAPDNPNQLGVIDALGTMTHWPDPTDHGLENDGTLDDLQQSWQSTDVSSDPYYADLNSAMQAARQKHHELGGRDVTKAVQPL